MLRMKPLSCKRTVTIVAVCATLIALLVLVAAKQEAPSGMFRIGFAPIFRIDIAARKRWMVQSGVNFVRDSGVGLAGNFIEFPIFPGYRIGIRYFSKRWRQEEHAK
jgi:hypothetical protein